MTDKTSINDFINCRSLLRMVNVTNLRFPLHIEIVRENLKKKKKRSFEFISSRREFPI